MNKWAEIASERSARASPSTRREVKLGNANPYATNDHTKMMICASIDIEINAHERNLNDGCLLGKDTP